MTDENFSPVRNQLPTRFPLGASWHEGGGTGGARRGTRTGHGAGHEDRGTGGARGGHTFAVGR
ncbi:hypothetical protein GCM10027575_49660 [Phytohabitans suffuscus]